LFVQLDPTAFQADPELIGALEQRSTPVGCEADRVLFRQDDPASGLYIIHQGEVALKMDSPAGHPLLTTTAQPGSLLGLPGLIGNQPYSLTATALAGARISFVGRDEFQSLMQSDPMLTMKMLQVLAAEVRSARLALY
jgi:CRP-like cAMP-binding protein